MVCGLSPNRVSNRQIARYGHHAQVSSVGPRRTGLASMLPCISSCPISPSTRRMCPLSLPSFSMLAKLDKLLLFGLSPDAK